MPIVPGEPWETGLPQAGDLVVCGSDGEAREAVVAAKRAGRTVPPVGLVGGDLWRTLGAPGGGEARLRGPAAIAFPVDVGEVLLDGRIDWFVAHLVARRRGWVGRAVAVMNAELIGRWTVAPRAHPGDGLFDVVDSRLGWRERLQARRRLPTGGHVPHPRIGITRTHGIQLDLGGLPVRLDGVPVGRVETATLRVLDHALTVVV